MISHKRARRNPSSNLGPDNIIGPLMGRLLSSAAAHRSCRLLHVLVAPGPGVWPWPCLDGVWMASCAMRSGNESTCNHFRSSASSSSPSCDARTSDVAARPDADAATGCVITGDWLSWRSTTCARWQAHQEQCAHMFAGSGVESTAVVSYAAAAASWGRLLSSATAQRSVGFCMLRFGALDPTRVLVLGPGPGAWPWRV